MNAECTMQNAECTMQNAECGMRNARRATGGSVLMEYVVLCCGIALVLLLAMQSEGEWDGKPLFGFYNYEQGYIGLGAEWANHVKILHRAMALPVP